MLAENLVELDRLEEAAAEIDVDLGAAAGTFIEPFVLTIRGRVRLLLRRFDEAEADLRRVVAFGDARGWAAPNATRGRLRLAEVLAASGRQEEALALMDHDVAAAQRRPASRLPRHGAAPPRAGAGRRRGDRDAARGGRGARRHRPAARARLGAARPRRAAADPRRPPRRRASPCAARSIWPRRTESALLARHAHAELEASGARLRRERLEGVEALTPAERRVAQLAAEGLTNRQIAETLWVTLKTVEVHLGRSYGKLGIAGRGELVAALGLEDGARAA